LKVFCHFQLISNQSNNASAFDDPYYKNSSLEDRQSFSEFIHLNVQIYELTKVERMKLLLILLKSLHRL